MVTPSRWGKQKLKLKWKEGEGREINEELEKTGNNLPFSFLFSGNVIFTEDPKIKSKKWRPTQPSKKLVITYHYIMPYKIISTHYQLIFLKLYFWFGNRSVFLTKPMVLPLPIYLCPHYIHTYKIRKKDLSHANDRVLSVSGTGIAFVPGHLYFELF